MTAGAPTLGGLNRLSTAPFQNITSNGVPVIPGVGLFSGRYIYCDAVNGSDTNIGTADRPVASLTQAYALATAGKNDVIVIVGDGATTATQRLSAKLTWAKNATHLMGMTAPAINKRARISTVSGATTNISNLIDVTANGCCFLNFSLFQGVGQTSTAEELFQVSGSENYFGNIDFLGMGSVAGAAEAGSYSLKLYGAQENVFENCYIGVDTRDRDAANTNILIRKNASAVASTRNIFRNCTVAMRATDTDPTFVNSNEAGGLDRFVLFDGCTFINSGTSALAAAVAGKTDQGGKVILNNCSVIGASEWGNLSNDAAILVTGAVPNGNTSGVAVNANPS